MYEEYVVVERHPSEVHLEAHTLGELLVEIRGGFEVHKPILVILESSARLDLEALESERSLFAGRHVLFHRLDRTKREYGNHRFVFLGPNTVEVSPEEPVTMGRSRRCVVRVDNDSVSKIHTSVAFDRETGEYQIVDECSRGGTYIDADMLTPGIPSPLHSGTYISVGDAVFRFLDPSTVRMMTLL